MSTEEGRRPQRISRTAKDPVKLRRALVVLMSAQGQTVKDITTLMQVGEDYVREVIHAFNERGFDALDPKWSGGRPRTINGEVRERVCLIARTSSADWKITAFSTRSLSKLAEHLVKHKVTAAISRETLRRILRAGRQGLLEDHHHVEGVHRPGVQRQDAPHPGALRHPACGQAGDMRRRVRAAEPDAAQGQGVGRGEASAQLRATYNRHNGVRHMLAALDLATGKLYYRIRPRKRWREFLDLLKALRARWPGEKPYVVLDYFSPHKHAKVRAWAAVHQVERVVLPTYGSWLNWIEAEFAALRYFALNGTDHRSHDEQNAAVASYIR
ncbi:helix-turn-helix domain-containing protein [Streptomyces sp. NPDC055134]